MNAINYGAINASIRTLNLEAEHTIQPASMPTLIQRLVTLYRGLRPLLMALATLPFIPASWRAALAAFLGVLEAVATASATPSRRNGGGRSRSHSQYRSVVQGGKGSVMRTKVTMVKVGRSAITGRFVTLRATRRRPSTTIVETKYIRVKRNR